MINLGLSPIKCYTLSEQMDGRVEGQKSMTFISGILKTWEVHTNILEVKFWYGRAKSFICAGVAKNGQNYFRH